MVDVAVCVWGVENNGDQLEVWKHQLREYISIVLPVREGNPEQNQLHHKSAGSFGQSGETVGCMH